MWNQRVQLAIASAALVVWTTGCCMVPQYRLPQGFSSSYHRQLYGMEPVVVGGIPEDQIPLNPAPGVFFPEKVELNDRPVETQTADRPSTRVSRVMIPPPLDQKKAAPKR